MKKGSKEHKEYMRAYNASHREFKRQWMWNKRHANGEYEPITGNDKYKELLKEHRKWVKGAPICEICKQKHWPHKAQIDLDVQPEDFLLEEDLKEG